MIRPTEPTDSAALIEIATGTGAFKPMEIVALGEVLDDYFAVNRGHGHHAVTFLHNDRPIGFAYYAPAAMTERAWYLYWIAVDKQTHARGIGGALLHYAETEIRAAGGRVLFIETSSLPHYELTRRFYLKHDYEQDAVVHDYYAEGDHMIVFRKRFDAAGGATQ